MSTVIPETADLADARRRCQRLEWMFFDVDGVMTDGGLFYSDQGEAFKRLTKSIVLVASTSTNTETCGAENMLLTMA